MPRRSCMTPVTCSVLPLCIARFLTSTMQPLFPEQASTIAPRVDNLYFFITAVSAFFALVVTVLVIVFAIKYRRRHPDEVRGADSRIPGARADLDGHPVHPRDGDVRLGRQCVFRDRAAAAETLGHLCRRQAVDVEVPAPRRASARSTSCTCPSNTPVRMIITSEDVLHDLYLPVVPRQDGRDSRPLHAALVHGDQARARITSSARSTAARSTPGMIGSVTVMAQDDYQTG